MDEFCEREMVGPFKGVSSAVDSQSGSDRLEDEEAEHRQEIEAEAERQRVLLAEQEAAILEDRKKNKSKYTPIRNTDIPSNPVILPCQYAIRKMKSEDYCELFYFTNAGLEETSRATFTADEDALVMLPTSDGLHKWIPAGAARDPKVHMLKDENLTWEQFNEAAPCMISVMRENDWLDDRIDMHVAFWLALQNHRWWHDFNAHKQRALLLYQAQQQRRWHLSIGSSNSWSLAKINQDLLNKA
ncbi:uncharacterized protein F5891DRAFT_1187126 [Suillus fuscotomentosus]|uniref:Uncharacterized protein n=1 Tax=Suillus fuscotomentosus TaxID=1912939 RepID=A0AAD4E8P0_9AGAM|nr:uncharacterized protein F5891DRAFT_1187126 [Suillus fuscotomentosus]KAG1901671.1 hypothetical protein F5891DRAFT_1187126 [Suillus fuscotomentosus]